MLDIVLIEKLGKLGPLLGGIFSAFLSSWNKESVFCAMSAYVNTV